ncbi:MAG: GNAT family N-acetyltransferase [Dehalococcoidia bacterium]|nr:GNAT family N-acetyltransferase [Dehalococcoidia bacterium]
MEVRELRVEDTGILARIDRSEHVDVQYGIEDGQLLERPVSMAGIPPWDPAGDGSHSVADKVAFCRRCIEAGARFLGAFEGDELLGAAVVDGRFEPRLAWLAFLHVSRPHRRRGVASALWDAAVGIAQDARATSMYVSATPTGSAVGFYLARGCQLADPVHPGLFALEPEDIHLVLPLR